MTLEELIKEKLDRIDNIPKDFTSDVQKSQAKIFREILILIDQLERDGDIILFNNNNVNLLNNINDQLINVVSNSEYKTAVKSFIAEFDKQGLINVDVLEKTIENVVITEDSRIVLDIFKRQAAENLIGSSALTQQFTEPIKKSLTNIITTRGSYADLVDEIRLITVGDSERLGKLHRYSRQIGWDLLATTDRAYTKSISEENGIEFYRYAGGLVEDSRHFCITRNDNYYHKNEISDWGKIKDWEGRIPGTDESNIFTNLSGYNCRHSLIPIGIVSVPKDVLQRNIDNGNLKITKKQKILLKLV